MKTIAVLGSGMVGQVLADGLLARGHEVVRGTRDPGKLEAWRSGAGARASVATFADAARRGEIVVLAVKGLAAESVVDLCAGQLDDKTVIDTCNPIADRPPENGVLHYFTTLEESLMERLQRRAPAAHFVKAFSCVGNALMVNPGFDGTRPTMFLCGNHEGAKAEVVAILDAFGWDAEDLGRVEAARAIEPLCILWCIPGFLRNRWTHALKQLRK